MKRLLIVDDDPELCLILAELFQDQYEVVTVKQVEDVAACFDTACPDLVLLDYCLWDGLKGDSLLRWMKAKCPSMPVLMMSGLPTVKDALLAAGADAFFEKPIDHRALLKSCEALG